MSYQKKCKYFSREYVGNPGAVPVCDFKQVLEVFDCSSCNNNPDNKKPTNADRIRAMSDEELADTLRLVQRNPKRDMPWLDWLRSPVEVEDGT